MDPEKIAFHQTSLAPNVREYLADACSYGQSLFRGKYNQMCREVIEAKFNCGDVVLTSSCTDALTMATLVAGIGQGDAVIIPSYTFASVANVFENRGIRIQLADSQEDHPNMDPESFQRLIGPNSRAVVFMSYGGQNNGIEEVTAIAEKHGLVVIEDAAHSFGSMHQNRAIGSFGDLASFSFHDSKALSCGQGGVLLVNHAGWGDRIRSIRDHGTNRWQVEEGRCDAYNWTSLGGEFNLPELSAALLFGQMEHEEHNQVLRKNSWHYYYNRLLPFSAGRFELPEVPGEGCNYPVFYMVLKTQEQRTAFIAHMASRGIAVAIHYTGLHRSSFYRLKYGCMELPHADRFALCLIRLPLYAGLTMEQLERVCLAVEQFYTKAYDASLV